MKVFNYIVITLGLMLLLEFSGINVTGLNLANWGLGTDGINANNSSFYNYLFGSGIGILMIAAVGAGIVAGFLTGGKSENFIILPLIGIHLVLLVSSWVNIIKFSQSNYPSWIFPIIIIIFGPLTVGYIFSLVEFFGGRD